MKRVSLAQLGVVLAAGAAVLSPVFRSQAQPTAGTPGFNFPYKKEGLLKARFTGASAKPVSLVQPTLLVVEQFQVETFRDDGAAELIGTAPQCRLNVGTKDASSAGPIPVTQADGLFKLQGDGFHWNQESGRLVLSNHVRTTFRFTIPAATPESANSRP